MVHRVLERYVKVMGSKINCNKSSDLRLGVWKGVREEWVHGTGKGGSGSPDLAPKTVVLKE